MAIGNLAWSAICALDGFRRVLFMVMDELLVLFESSFGQLLAGFGEILVSGLR
jgi:hypothetical protein